MRADEARSILIEAQASLRKTAIQASGHRIAKINAIQSAGVYDLAMSDGKIMFSVSSQSNTVWAVGQAVTIEKSSSYWMITGVAAASF